MLDEVSIGVTDGELTGDESWVYVWLKDNEVLYVGATRLPLGARTWLHLTNMILLYARSGLSIQKLRKDMSLSVDGGCPVRLTVPQ